MCSQEEIAQQRELLEIYRRTLAHHLRQIASLGAAFTPPYIVNGVYEARANIERIKIFLRSYAVPVEDLPTDKAQSGEQIPARIVPRQIPQVPDNYVERSGIEQELGAALLAEDGSPLVILYGLSGTGKSSLAAYVVQRLKETDFPDGVLWGNLSNFTPSDVFLNFLGARDSTWYHSAPREKIDLRNIFWQTIIDTNARALIVFDHVQDYRQLVQLLPNHINSISQNRILAITTQKIKDLPLEVYRQRLGYFIEKEAEKLFIDHLGEEKFDIYQKQLYEIGQQFEYVPQLLVSAARDFASGKASPGAYALRLRQTEGQNALMTNAVREGLDLAIRELNHTQIDLFESIGVLGEGDWHIDMLAAITLRMSADVIPDLDLLVERELVARAAGRRYHVNRLIREFAQTRFAQRTEYVRKCASMLLARYCLDIAQDLVVALDASPDLRVLPDQSVDRATVAFVRAFRSRLLPEMSHIRRVLEWAASNKAWDILLRFSHVAHIELHRNFIANSFEVRKTCVMATIVEPIVWQQGDRRHMQVQSSELSTDWQVTSLSKGEQPLVFTHTSEGLSYGQDAPPDDKNRCELSLEISAGHITDGLFDSMCLIDARWIGVRAGGLICKHVDIGGGRFLACDFSYSVWTDCDARRITLLGSTLRYALLKDVKLHGADLRGIDLTGAVLDHVDLRGADLRGANLTGAVLHVDLRGADLRGANLTAIQAREVNLIGCRMEGAHWAGAKTKGVIIEQSALVKEIELKAAMEADVSAELLSKRWRPLRGPKDHSATDVAKPDSDVREPDDRGIPDFSDTDLRAFDLRAANLTEYIFRGADLTAAQLQEAMLDSADLSTTILRGADFSKANLTKSNLRGANLRAAILCNANLEYADLTKAVLRSAQLVKAHLRDALLKSADVRRANLADADLSNAVLIDADLTDANLRCAILKQADLRDAHLQSADLSDADLTEAILADAVCIGTDFRGATIDERQLAQAARLDGATLPEGQVVEVLAAPDYESITPSIDLRFAHLDGIFKRIDLSGRGMRGAHLDGMFVEVNLAGVDLSYGRLVGDFSQVDCTGANLSSARLSGTFVEVDFCSADFQGANLSGASLINVDLRDARNVSDDQLRQASRLRGTLMPDGSRYDGRFDLAGDREDAPKAGVDPDDPAAMARFLDGSKPKFVPPKRSS